MGCQAPKGFNAGAHAMDCLDWELQCFVGFEFRTVSLFTRPILSETFQ
jgi:hypothetical protein